jgi:hypothetical protein
MKIPLIKCTILLIFIISLLIIFGVGGCTQSAPGYGCFGPTAEERDREYDKMIEEGKQKLEEGKQKLEEITDKLPDVEKPEEKPAESPTEEPTEEPKAEESTPKTTEEECRMEGKWKITVEAEEAAFTSKGGTTYSCDPFDIMFQIRDWQIERMHSPKYGYMSADYGGQARIILNRNGYLEIIIEQGNTKDIINGWLNLTDGAGAWESYLILDDEEYEGCHGKWEAERTGELSE